MSKEEIEKCAYCEVPLLSAIANYNANQKFEADLKAMNAQRAKFSDFDSAGSRPKQFAELSDLIAEKTRDHEDMMKATKIQLTLAEALEAAKQVDKLKTVVVKDETGRRRKFQGTMQACTSTRWVDGREQTRWTEKTLYTTASGKFVIAMANVTCWEGEQDTYSYDILNNLDEIDQDLLDEMRKNLCEQFNAAIPLSEVATIMEGV
ncbi:MAG: hypothetical protein KGN01_07700 [Patescibacteria group bacterium]|nr:hypothetical protein [Patescibacteria group bacterium]